MYFQSIRSKTKDSTYSNENFLVGTYLIWSPFCKQKVQLIKEMFHRSFKTKWLSEHLFQNRADDRVTHTAVAPQARANLNMYLDKNNTGI